MVESIFKKYGQVMSHSGCPVNYQAVVNPEAIAVMAGDLAWNYAALDRRIQRMAAGLVDQGLQPGDVLVAVGSNSPLLLVLVFACLRSGVIILPINPSFPEIRVQELIRLSGAKGLWQESPELCTDWQGLVLPVNLAHIDGEPREFSWSDTRICNLVLTSGSSGFPKAAAYSFSCHRASARASASVIPLSVGDGWLLSLPLYHIGGLAILFRCVLSGARMIFPDHRRNLAQTLIKRQVTHISLVNTQLYRLLTTTGFDFAYSSSRVVLVGGGYVAADLAARCRKQGVKVLTTYGMTEACSQIATGEPEFLEFGALTSGQPLPGIELQLSDKGDIKVRGETLFRGYWNNGTIALPLTEDGWFATGDKGCWHGEQIQIKGRCDSRFISGGENIQPEDIERALLGCPEISRVVVVPVNSEEFGRRPVAFVECNNDEFHPLLWSQHLRELIPRFMVPDAFFPWPNECINAGLKVSRKDMAVLARKRVLSSEPSGFRDHD